MDAASGNFHGGGILFGTPLCALAGIERGAVFLDFCETSPTGTHRNHAFPPVQQDFTARPEVPALAFHRAGFPDRHVHIVHMACDIDA